MNKTIKIKVISGCVHYQGEVYAVGDPAFECEEKEARRLIDLKVAGNVSEEEAAAEAALKRIADEEEAEAKRIAEEDQAAQEAEATKAEFIAAIQAAGTYEDVLALMPEEEPDPEIAEVFEKRLEKLKEG